MKKLDGQVYIIPVPQADSSSTRLGSSDYRIRKFISGLLGLSEVPEKWLAVCARDGYDHRREETSFDVPDGNGEGGKRGNRTSSDWSENGYFLDGLPGIIPFPGYLPALLFEGKQEDDVVTFAYGDMEVSLALKQLPGRYGRLGRFEQVFARMTETAVRETDNGEAEESDGGEEKSCFPACGEQRPETVTAAKVLAGVLGGLILVAAGIAIGVCGAKRNR
jgi:hypothetical protein